MSDADKLRDANPWHPITDAIDLKHLGKLAEEAAELGDAVASRAAMVYGVAGMHRTSWHAIEHEIADVRANSELVIARFRLDDRRIAALSQARVHAHAGSSPVLLRLAADACRLGCAVARCIIQGVDEREPVTGRLNRDWLEQAIADVWGESDLTIERCQLDAQRIGARIEHKKHHLKQWHALA
ncbi:hypothetical protein [Bradyrhizobium sp. HKCCYLR1023]|uniref:hypothetical protein n=1 Tax=Bradyrhizobium TaxID=374 RepID=UPI003EB97132